MKVRRIHIVIACSLLCLGQQALAQLLPAVQNALERQAERVGNKGVERSLEQVQDKVVAATLEQVQDQVVATTVEQVEQGVVGQVLERATAAVEQVAVDGAVSQVQEQALSQAQDVADRVQDKALTQVQGTVETVQGQALDRVQRNVDVAQGSALGQVQQAVENLLPQATTPVIDKLEPMTSDDTPAIAVPDAAADVALTNTSTDGVAAAVAADSVAAGNNAALVEITLEPGIRAVEFEWLMLVTAEQRARLSNEAAELMNYLTETQPFALIDGELLTFTVPPDLDAAGALLELVPEGMRELIDRNHIYEGSQHTSGGDHGALLPLPMPAVCDAPVAVGIIDSAVDTTHPALAQRSAAIDARSFVDGGIAQPSGHGTAVAGMLIGEHAGKHGARLRPLLPKAKLYSAAVFHEQEGSQQGATLMRVLAALDWLTAQDEVRVINMSLAGPPNRLLEQAVAAASAKGRVIVAAVGNEGPHAPARYPAAYDTAIGVTAVSRDGSVFRFANQGEHIDYAALGVAVPTALHDGSVGPGSGTSLAAPVVSAFFACELAHEHSREKAQAALDKRALDLGPPGADPMFGRGLLYP